MGFGGHSGRSAGEDAADSHKEGRKSILAPKKATKARMASPTKEEVQKAIDQYVAGLEDPLRELNQKVLPMLAHSPIQCLMPIDPRNT